MRNRLTKILALMMLFCSLQAVASHIVGGEGTYKFMGTQYVGGTLYNKYQVSITIYEDCQNGQPSAIQADNPAFLAAYDLKANDSAGHLLDVDTNVYYQSSVLVPANFSHLCISNPPVVCLLKKTFVKTYLFRPSAYGNIIVYQRCCRNAAIVNIFDPGDIGATYYCKIPPTGIAETNNSAIFNNYPPQIICINNPLFYDHSASDADGDSLTYEFTKSLKGANTMDIKPVPAPPPYDTVTYLSPYSYLHPMTGQPQIQINPTTGLITGTPNRIGRFLVTVCCHEWRHGIKINTVTREFQFVVTNCSKAVIADIPQFSTDPNTYQVNCKNFDEHFVNTSSGGITYHWDFGVAGTLTDTSALFEPSFSYADTGTYVVKLNVNPGSTCTDSIWRYVKIYPYFTADFADTGIQCPGKLVGFMDRSTSTLKPISNWIWSFGDGNFSNLQNPVYSYSVGGTYNVMLISQNIKDCADTAVEHITIENFKPFAGNDTIIVKGESIVFEATGGINYSWQPGYYLNDVFSGNPIGHYPDTGSFTYYVHVSSAYGCFGYDTIKVQVVANASFFMPTAFSPNGDGKNDFFRPIAIGYKNLNYLRVFNRWGQMVYATKNFETGWDGTFEGKPCEMGTYYWEINYNDRYGILGQMKGDVTLVR